MQDWLLTFRSYHVLLPLPHQNPRRRVAGSTNRRISMLYLQGKIRIRRRQKLDCAAFRQCGKAECTTQWLAACVFRYRDSRIRYHRSFDIRQAQLSWVVDRRRYVHRSLLQALGSHKNFGHLDAARKQVDELAICPMSEDNILSETLSILWNNYRDADDVKQFAEAVCNISKPSDKSVISISSEITPSKTLMQLSQYLVMFFFHIFRLLQHRQIGALGFKDKCPVCRQLLGSFDLHRSTRRI